MAAPRLCVMPAPGGSGAGAAVPHWRPGPGVRDPGLRAGLPRRQLAGADLANLILNRVNLVNADLTDATLVDVSLVGADLTGTTLFCATVIDSGLTRVSAISYPVESSCRGWFSP